MVQYLHPASLQGASDQRHETRGGMRWPLCAKDVSRAPEAQAVPDPAASAGGHWAQAVRGKVRPPARSGASVVVVNKCHAVRSKPQTPRAERRVTGFSVVTESRVVLSQPPHGAAGRLRARRSARPCFKGIERGVGLRAPPRRLKNRAAFARPQQRTVEHHQCRFAQDRQTNRAMPVLRKSQVQNICIMLGAERTRFAARGV